MIFGLGTLFVLVILVKYLKRSGCQGYGEVRVMERVWSL